MHVRIETDMGSDRLWVRLFRRHNVVRNLLTAVLAGDLGFRHPDSSASLPHMSLLPNLVQELAFGPYPVAADPLLHQQLKLARLPVRSVPGPSDLDWSLST